MQLEHINAQHFARDVPKLVQESATLLTRPRILVIADLQQCGAQKVDFLTKLTEPRRMKIISYTQLCFSMFAPHVSDYSCNRAMMHPMLATQETLAALGSACPDVAKLVLFSEVPLKRHKVSKALCGLEKPEHGNMTEEDDADEEEEEEEEDPDLYKSPSASGKRASSPPVVTVAGTMRQTSGEKMSNLAKDREDVRKSLFDSFGDGINRHYPVPYTLLFTSPLHGRVTSEGLVLCPSKAGARLGSFHEPLHTSHNFVQFRSEVGPEMLTQHDTKSRMMQNAKILLRSLLVFTYVYSLADACRASPG